MDSRSLLADAPPAVAALVRAIELSEAFQLCVLVGRWQDLQPVVAQTIELVRQLSPEGLVVRWTSSTQQLRDEHHPSTTARSIVVFDARGEAAGDEYRALNVSRDTLRERGRTTLLVLLSDETETVFAEAAPDLRSIYSEYVRVPMGWPDEEAFARWVADCRGAFEAKVAGTPGAADLYAHGVYSFAYELDRVERRVSVPELRDAMRSFRGWTGWRPWWVPHDVHPPHAAGQGELECWMLGGSTNDPAHSDFWRASTAGRFYLLRGYAEDSSPERVHPGRIFSSSLVVWRVAEGLLHAEQAASHLGGESSWVHFVARWEGLQGRRWSAWPSDVWDEDEDDVGTASVGEVSSSLVCRGAELRERLGELALEVVRPLSDAFLAEMPPSMVQREISRLLKRPRR